MDRIFQAKRKYAILANCNTGYGINEILKVIEKIKQKEIEEFVEKGRIGRKIRAMVLRDTKCWKIIIYK